MAKKKLKKKVQRRSSASKLSTPVIESARDVWLAGLGALNIAQQESGKFLEQGGKLFDRLVKEGGKFENKARSDIEGAVSDLRGEVDDRMSGVRQRTESVRKQASDNWDKLEKIFEERVARALASLGIPTRDDINGLSGRVAQLAEQVRQIDSGKRGSTAKSSASKKTSSKKKAPGRKKTPSRKKTPGRKKSPSKKKTSSRKKSPAKKAVKKTAKKKAVKKTVKKKAGSNKS